MIKPLQNADYEAAYERHGSLLIAPASVKYLADIVGAEEPDMELVLVQSIGEADPGSIDKSQHLYSTMKSAALNLAYVALHVDKIDSRPAIAWLHTTFDFELMKRTNACGVGYLVENQPQLITSVQASRFTLPARYHLG